MSLVLRRTYVKARTNIFSSRNTKITPHPWSLGSLFSRVFSDDKSNSPDFSNSTILIENGFNVQELPVVVRKLKDLSEIEEKPSEETVSTTDSVNYNLIQAEFRQCVDLRDVFSLLSKCTKITPNIALGAVERIYDLEKNPTPVTFQENMYSNSAKGAIIDKLIKVVMKTEETQTILNVLQTSSTFFEPYKYKFCDEILFRVVDNKLTIEQICEFVIFLMLNKADHKYAETIDKLWVGFVGRESDINENNIVEIFKILPALKISKRIILTLLEQKLSDLWTKIKPPIMQEILSAFIEDKYVSLQSYNIVGSWLCANIHAVYEDSLLDIITKLTRLNYTDDQVEKAVEKYMKLKGSKIHSHILIVGILNYSMQFQIQNKDILNACSEYFLNNYEEVPPSFLKSTIYPFGYLNYNPERSAEFWERAEKSLHQQFHKMNVDDLASIILSFIYAGHYPLSLADRVFSPEYLSRVNNSETLKKLHLVDTALTLECEAHVGPRLPKDQWSKPITQDRRITNILDKIKDTLVSVAGGSEKLSTAVTIPYLYSDETYLIDVMIHPTGLGSKNFNWKLKSAKNENIAVLIHLPDHYCSNNECLIGPQVMRKKHLKLLGLKVVSLKYSIISQFYTSYNTNGLKKYLSDCIDNAEPCQ